MVSGQVYPCHNSICCQGQPCQHNFQTATTTTNDLFLWLWKVEERVFLIMSVWWFYSFFFLWLIKVTGVTLIIVAAVIQGLYWKYVDFLDNQFLSAPILFIIVGVIIFLVAFFGCCGAVKENNCMIMTVCWQCLSNQIWFYIWSLIFIL